MSGKLSRNAIAQKPAITIGDGSANTLPAEKSTRRLRPRRSSAEAQSSHLAGTSTSDLLLRYLFYPALLLAAVLVCSIRPVAEPDSWFHMTFGRYVLTYGDLPPGDIYSFTGAGHEWISTGWAASVLLHYAYERFNVAGLAYSVFLVTAASYLSIYFVAVRRYGNRGSIVLVLLSGILASCLRFSPRPELWSHLGATLVILLLITAEDTPRAREGWVPRRLWLLPLGFIVWANLHGGFFLGFVPLAVYSAWKLLQSYRTRNWGHVACIVPCALSLFTWILNPYGARILILLGQVKDAPTIKTHIIEWMPLIGSPQHLLPWPTYLGVALVIGFTLLTAVRKGRRLPAWHLALLALFVLLEFQARRHVAVASLVIAAVLVPHLGFLDSLAARRRALLPALALAATLALGHMKYTNRLGLGGGLMVTGCETTVLPCIATEYLRQNPPPQPIFNSYGAGGYLMYFLGPQLQVFIDGRFYVYDPQVWEDFIATQDGKMSIEQVCERYKTQTFIIYTQDNPDAPHHLANRLTKNPDWKLVFFCDSHAVFVHDTPENRSYLASQELKYVSPFAPERLQKALADTSTRQAAQLEIQRALEISMGSANATACAALAAHMSGDPTKAGPLLASAMERYPNSPLVHFVWERTKRTGQR